MGNGQRASADALPRGRGDHLQLVRGNGHRVEFRALRGAVDRQRLLYLHPIDPAQWQALCALAEGGEGVTLDHGGAPLPCEVWRQGSTLIVQSDAFWLEVRSPLVLVEPAATVDLAPGSETSPRAARRPFVQLEVRGLACAHATNGQAAVQAARETVEALCWPEVPRAELAPASTAGQFDVAFDINVRGPDADAWISVVLYAAGNIDQARAQWASRARSKSIDVGGDAQAPEGDDDERDGRTERGRLLGAQRSGRSLYLGGGAKGKAPLEVCIYEKDRLQNDGWRVLSETLRTLGWDGEGRVVRVEFRADRAWLRDQVVQGARLDRLTFDEFTALLPSIARAFCARYRHTEGEETRVRRRATSAFWRAAYECARRLDGPGELRVSDLRSLKRERTLARGRDALAGLFALWCAVGGRDGAPLEWHEAHNALRDELLTVSRDPKRASSIERKRLRAMLRIGAVPEPAPAAVA